MMSTCRSQTTTGCAADVLRSLAPASRHPKVGLNDLIGAAVAEEDRISIPHHDPGDDVISAFPCVIARWVVEPGVVA
jgi:hypothetical protein